MLVLIQNVEIQKIINKFNSLANQYSKIKVINDTTNNNFKESRLEIIKLKEENNILKTEIKNLKQYINKAFECTSILFDWSMDRLQRIINNFAKESDKSESDITRNKKER